jgi:hypothetical protein
MSEPKPIQPGISIQGAQGAKPRAGAAAPPGAGVAFRALIERLEEQARALAAEAERVERPADLAGAVDRAHASLEDALALEQAVIEAWRASKLGGGPR